MSDFSAPVTILDFSALLFDMDGTIVDSTPAIIKHWHRIGAQLGVDPDVIMASSHGRRSIDTLALYDKSLANWEYVSEIEGRIPREYGQDAVEIPGARKLLASLDAAGAPWMIVTSGTRALVTGWLDVMKLTHPEKLVVAEDVDAGKPDPQCYRLGASRLSVPEGGKVLVLEDSPAGVKAGKAAGFVVVAVVTTHRIEQLRAAGADFIVRDLRSVQLVEWDGERKVARVEIADALVV